MPRKKKVVVPKKDELVVVRIPISNKTKDIEQENNEQVGYDPTKFNPVPLDTVTSETPYFSWDTIADQPDIGLDENQDPLPLPQDCTNKEPLPQMSYNQLFNDAINTSNHADQTEYYDKHGNPRLLPEFAAASKQGILPSSVSCSYCWWDCHPFEGAPAVIPLNIVSKPGKKGIINVFGCFCSYNCAYAYYLYDPQKFRHDVPMLMKFMYRKLHGEPLNLVPAPNRLLLKIFGGLFTIEQFRSEAVRNKNVHILDINIVSMISMYEIKFDFFNDSANKLNTSTDDTKSSSDNLRIKRSKPLKREGNTLAACFANYETQDDE